MNKSEINKLQNIIMGQCYDAGLINKAINFADTLEARVLLISLRAGRTSFEARMELQNFINRLLKAA